MKVFLFIIITLITTSCVTMKYNANIKNLSEENQLIEVTIHEISFDRNEPLIERITINIFNKANSTIIFNSEKCYFRDDNGFHALKIPPINIKANDNVNISIESLDYYITISNMYSSRYSNYSSGTSVTSMQDLNVNFLEIILNYKINDREYNGTFYIDVNKIITQ